MRVQAIAWTHFQAPEGVDWSTDADGGQALAEFAGRACYQSWTKPNPATATNSGYLAHILEVGHLSVLEHGTVTMYFTGVSRSFTHELIRHRHFSYSQLSQRYVTPEGNTAVPKVIADDPYLLRVFTEAATAAEKAYHELAHGLHRTISTARAGDHQPAEAVGDADGNQLCSACFQVYPCKPATRARTSARKAARQAARSVLPNAAETRIVVTGNFRAWRHFIDLRATEAADVEIREAAIAVLAELSKIAPNVFADYNVTTLADGTQVAASWRAERS